ncbi:MAG: hypothetical protein QXZ20_00205 [Candidatus Aenigmatarchaeota archaeon]
MLYLENIIYLLIIFSSVTLGNYIILRKTETKNIILLTIIIFFYSLYLSRFFYYYFPLFPTNIKDSIVWILISIIFNKSEGIVKSTLIGISSFSIFFILILILNV